MIIEKDVWIFRPLPHGINRIIEFLKDDFIAIGYPLGISFEGLAYGQVKKLLDQKGWGEGIGNVKIAWEKFHIIRDNHTINEDLYFDVLNVLKELLNDSNPDIRLKAAEVVLKYNCNIKRI